MKHANMRLTDKSIFKLWYSGDRMACGPHLIWYWTKWRTHFSPLLGDVFVIYCKDRGSQTLPPNQLYNTKLHSINQHATLVKLKKKNRVFSVYESLHPQQAELLEDRIKQLWFWYMCCENFLFLNHVHCNDFDICDAIVYSFIILLVIW